jgi:hypothetical protein
MALRAVSATTDGRTVPGDARPGPGRFAELALEAYLYLSPAGDPAIAMWGPIVANVWFGVRRVARLRLEMSRGRPQLRRVAMTGRTRLPKMRAAVE